MLKKKVQKEKKLRFVMFCLVSSFTDSHFSFFLGNKNGERKTMLGPNAKCPDPTQKHKNKKVPFPAINQPLRLFTRRRARAGKVGRHAYGAWQKGNNQTN